MSRDMPMDSSEATEAANRIRERKRAETSEWGVGRTCPCQACDADRERDESILLGTLQPHIHRVQHSTSAEELIEKIAALAAGVPKRMRMNTSGETQRQRGKEEFAAEVRDLINEYRNE